MAGTSLGTKSRKKRDSIASVLTAIYVLYLLCLVIIVGRIVRIKLTYKPDPEIAARLRPREVKTKLEPVRGAILSDDGRLLAISVPKYQIYMDCTVMKDEFARMRNSEKREAAEAKWLANSDTLAMELAEVFPSQSAKEFSDLIRNGRKNNQKYVRIGTPVSHSTLQKIKTFHLYREGSGRGGIIVEKKDSRQYPYGTLARRTIGYVKDNSNSNGNNHIGLEGRYDYVLHGNDGYEWLRITDGRKYIHDYDSSWVRPKDGLDIRTTLDIDIQDIADKAMRTNLEESQKIEGGCAIVMDVETGAIKAMVNLLRDSSSGKWNESLNMAISRIGEPGSVFKTTTLMSLLEDGHVRLSDEIPTNHGIVPGFTQDDHIPTYERQHNTNKISILHGFEISSNYVFRRLAIDYYGKNPKKMLDKLYMYKLGEPFDFDLDGMRSPTLPNPESPTWSRTDLGSVAIGYSVGETPLHIVTFYNAIAAGGKMMKPYLVESIEENGVVKEKRGPSVLNGSICSKATADSLTKALSRVTEAGTAKRNLSKAKLTVAGKTGTARIAQRGGGYTDSKGRVQYQSSFVGFFPAEAPRYSTIVTVYTRPGAGIVYGNDTPAKVFREITDKVYALDSRNGEVLSRKSLKAKGDK